jgi:hypothetical protein
VCLASLIPRSVLRAKLLVGSIPASLGDLSALTALCAPPGAGRRLPVICVGRALRSLACSKAPRCGAPRAPNARRRRAAR